MKKLFLGAAALVALVAAPAMAAEMPLKARPPAPAPTWNSCYIGVNGGWVGARSEFGWIPSNALADWGDLAVNTEPQSEAQVLAIGAQEVALLNTFGTNTLTTSGGTAGGEWGCNWQFGAAVFGYESDLQWTDVNSTLNGFFPGIPAITGATIVPGIVPQAFTESVTSRWLSTSRFRAGVASGPWLLYGTAGIAVARITFVDQVVFIYPPGTNPPFAANAVSTTDTKVGWTVGGGFEWMVWGNWTVKGEYLYVDLGRVTNVSFNNLVFNPISAPFVAGALITHNHNLHEQIARVGLNYQFNWGALAPKY